MRDAIENHSAEEEEEEGGVGQGEGEITGIEIRSARSAATTVGLCTLTHNP
jgi:hypothetical protein